MTIRKRTWTTKAGKTMTCWYIDIKFRHPDGHIQRVRQASPVNTKRGAQRYELEVRAALLHGTFGKEDQPDDSDHQPQRVHDDMPYLGEFAGEFIENYARVNNKPSSVESKQTILDKHLVPFFGRMRLDTIGPKQIERYKASKFRTHSKKSINNQLTVLRKLLTTASEWGYLKFVPKVKWMKAPKPEFRFLDFEQADALLEASMPEPPWHTMILVAMRTGLRQGELLALRWRDVDLATGRVVVRRAVARGIVGTPKGGRLREVPLTPSAIAALKAHRHLRSELVFCQEDGSMLTKGQCKWPLIRAKRRAGIERLGWHDLRHTFASHMVMRGVTLKAVQELLGHTTIEMTMRYAHLSPRALQEAVDVLESELGHIRGTWTGAKTHTGS